MAEDPRVVEAADRTAMAALNTGNAAKSLVGVTETVQTEYGAVVELIGQLAVAVERLRISCVAEEEFHGRLRNYFAATSLLALRTAGALRETDPGLPSPPVEAAAMNVHSHANAGCHTLSAPCAMPPAMQALGHGVEKLGGFLDGLKPLLDTDLQQAQQAHNYAKSMADGVAYLGSLTNRDRQNW